MAELPQALAHLQAGNIAPVDLAQAAIGPGMAVYTRYAKVHDAEGKSLSVRAINQTLDEALAEQEGDFDADTRWALTWFEQSGFAEGDFGIAEQLSKSKNTAVVGLVEAGFWCPKRVRCACLNPRNCQPTGIQLVRKKVLKSFVGACSSLCLTRNSSRIEMWWHVPLLNFIVPSKPSFHRNAVSLNTSSASRRPIQFTRKSLIVCMPTGPR